MHCILTDISICVVWYYKRRLCLVIKCELLGANGFKITDLYQYLRVLEYTPMLTSILCRV